MGSVQGVHPFYRLEFANDQILYQDINSKTFIQDDIIIDNWNDYLPLEGNASFVELMTKTYLIDILEKTGSKVLVDSKSGINYDFADLIFFIAYRGKIHNLLGALVSWWWNEQK